MALPALGCCHRLAVSLQSGLQLKTVPVPAVGSALAWCVCPPSKSSRLVEMLWTKSGRSPCAWAGNDREKENDGWNDEGVEKMAETTDKEHFGGLSREADAASVLNDEESRALLEDLAAAAARVSSLQADLESHKQREQEIAELRAEIEQYAEQQAAADSLVADCQNEVANAEKDLYAATVALVSARSGANSQVEISSNWRSSDVDGDSERKESGKAAAVSSLVGGLASLPFLLSERGLGLSAIIGVGGVLVGCGVFGVCFRYTVRRDLGNFQLKSGATAAFAIVTGIAEMDTTQALLGFPDQGWNEVLKAGVYAGESFLTFALAAVGLDYCLREGLLKPFPSRGME